MEASLACRSMCVIPYLLRIFNQLVSRLAMLQYCPTGADKAKVLKDMIFPLVSNPMIRCQRWSGTFSKLAS